MIEVTSIQVRSFDLDHLDISWALANTSEEISQFRFYVLRSLDGPAGPFREFAGPMWNTFLFRDGDVHLLHKWRAYYYKIKVVDLATGNEAEFGPAYLEAEPDRITLEIQRRNELLLQEYAGRKVLLYPAMTFGQRCGHCWDVNSRGNYLGRQQTQNCATCFDTTFAGGYATPIVCHVQIDPRPKAVQRTDTSERARGDTSARVSAFPPMKPKDMLIEAENVRWQVERVSFTKKLRAVVHQELLLHEIPRGDIRFKVPVNLDAFSTQWSPERAFTRAMTLGNDTRSVVPNKVVK